jgi:hypothetical protein
MIGQYLIRLAHQDRWDELRPIIALLENARQRAASSKDRNLQQRAQSMFDPEYSLVAKAMRLPALIQAAEKGVGVDKVLGDKHGYICIQMHAPPEPEGWQWTGQSGSVYADGRGFRDNHGWFWDAQPAAEGWGRTLARMVNAKTGEFWLVLHGTGSSVTIGGELTVLRDNYYLGHAENALTRKWSVKVDVPAPNEEDLQRWWDKATQGKGPTGYRQVWGLNAEQWRPAPDKTPTPGRPEPSVDKWLNEAETLRAQGHAEEAWALYLKIAAAKDEFWPEYYTSAANADLYLRETRIFECRAEAAACLGIAGHVDDAQKEFARLQESLPARIDYMNNRDINQRLTLLGAQVAMARGLFKQGKIDTVKQLLPQIESRRPVLSSIPGGMSQIDGGHGIRYSWDPRSRVRDAWRDFDTLWWDVQDAPATK